MIAAEQDERELRLKASTRSAARRRTGKESSQNGRLEVRAWLRRRTQFFHMQPKSLSVDKAVVTNYHIEQCNTGLLTRDPVRLSRHDLAAMLALIRHHIHSSAKRVP